MKRSEINKALKELEKMIADHQYYLPKFANMDFPCLLFVTEILK